jgi:hypothetical protein
VALSMPFNGSGEFVPVRVWSCSKHDEPDEHYCDCEFCEVVLCEECEAADWVDKLDENGEVVMRERDRTEAFLVQQLKNSFEQRLFFASPIVAKVMNEWTEDAAMPRITSPFTSKVQE